MKNRHTDTVTRVDVRIPNELYNQIQAIATNHFHAKIHHRSNKPEITPTIIELIKIGIAHLESTLPATDETEELELKEQIKDFDRRLKFIESKLSGVSLTATIEELGPTNEVRGLSDLELGELLGVSNLILRDYRVYGKKPKGKALADELTKKWEVIGDCWVKKSDR